MLSPVRLLICFLAFGYALTGCGASQREKTIHAAFVTTNAARDGFTTWDGKHQLDIVNKATSLEDGKTKLGDYRKQRDRVVELFTVTYQAIAAALLIDDSTTLPKVLSSAQALKDAIDALMKGP